MTMETALRDRLKGDAAVQAIVTARIDWSVRPQGTALPCIVLTVVADDRSQHMAGFNGFRPTRVQVDCYAASKSEAVSLREAALAAITPAATQSGVEFLRAFINSVLDRGEQAESGFIHREIIDLNLWHDA